MADTAAGVIYDRASARRIGNVVRRVESSLGRIGIKGGKRDAGWKDWWLLQVTSNAAGDGKYFGKTLGPGDSKPTASGDLTIADIGKIADAEDVLFFNLEEVDKDVGIPPHVLREDNQSPLAVGFLLDYTDEDPPKLVIAGLSLRVGNCDGDTSGTS